MFLQFYFSQNLSAILKVSGRKQNLRQPLVHTKVWMKFILKKNKVPCEQRDSSQERVVGMLASLVEASQANLERIVSEQEEVYGHA